MSYNPFSLQGKTILITGASSGIGKGVAIVCSKMGGRLIITGRNKERLDETFGQLEGDNHRAIIADLSSQEGIDYLISQCEPLDGVVHCAGIPKICPLKRLKRDLLLDIINTNELAPILLTAGLLKSSKLQRKSSVVFIASIAGVFRAGGVGDTDYSATKGALSGFTMTAAKELGTQGIRVNTICPAVVETPILAQSYNMMTEDELNRKLNSYAIRRFGQPEDVANGVVYLLSDASSWVTGINLAIDGGCHL